MIDKRRQKGEKTKQAILAATEKILTQKGGNCLSTRAIAKKAGISQSSLYHHFNTIEDVLFSCMQSMAEKRLMLYEKQEFSQLDEYFISLLDQSLEAPQIWRDVMFSFKEKAQQNEKLNQKIMGLGQEHIRLFRSSIKSIVGSEIEEDRLDLVIFALSIFIDGFMFHNHFFKKQSLFENQYEKAKDIIKLFCSHITNDQQPKN